MITDECNRESQYDLMEQIEELLMHFLYIPSKSNTVNNNCPFPVLMSSVYSHVALQVKQHCSLRNESVFQGNVHTVQTSQLAKPKLNCNAAAPAG